MKPAATMPLRVMLYSHETLRLPGATQQVRVKSGRAWVTLAGRDVVLTRGETLCVQARSEAALVSPLGCAPLIVEIVGETPQRPFGGWPRALGLAGGR